MENRRLIRVVGEVHPEENKYMGTRDEQEYFRVRALDGDCVEFYYSEEHYLATCKRLPENQRHQHQYYADEEDMDCAAGSGHLQVVKWLQGVVTYKL